MKNVLLILIVLVTSCATSKRTLETTKSDLNAVAFQSVERLLQKDGGNFWNQDLYGPILLVNSETREIIANQNNKDKNFEPVGSIYRGTLPQEVNIANTAIDWNQERWTMVMLPLPENEFERNKLIIHELFHGAQPALGFTGLNEAPNSHLDTYEGRLLLSLELEALKKALKSNNEKERRKHLSNALGLRAQRHRLNENSNFEENSLEINEGIAEYTALMLSEKDPKKIASHLVKNIDEFYQNPTYVRSFAYQTIPLYGYLLSKEDNNWHKKISRETVLSDFFKKSFAIEVPIGNLYEKLAANNEYNYKALKGKEEAREKQRLAKIKEYKDLFINGPHLLLRFEKMSISFDPRNITPLENYGTVYPQIRVSDNWGILTVENGALLNANWSDIIVTAPVKIVDHLVEGDGWSLKLNPDWEVIKDNGIFILKKL